MSRPTSPPPADPMTGVARTWPDFLRPGLNLACSPQSAEKFYPMPGTAKYPNKPAKRLCRRCEAREQCAAWALATRQAHGIWGGLTPSERFKALRERAAR